MLMCLWKVYVLKCVEQPCEGMDYYCMVIGVEWQKPYD